MPVTIACPKCQTKYKLPESSLGKALKCKKCGAGFKTKAPGQTQPAAQAQAQPKRPQAATSAADQNRRQQQAQEMKKLGLDGPLGRQGDIFGPALPQGAGQLSNFAAEDPGFQSPGSGAVGSAVDVKVEDPQDGPQTAQGMEAILGNPHVSPGAGGGIRGRVKQTTSPGDGYLAPKIGMWAVFVAAAVLLAVVLISTLISMLRQFAPDALAWFARMLGETGMKVFLFTLLGLMPTAVLTIFIGQILCIFSPNKNEKIFAGMSVGAIGLAILAFLSLYLMGALAGVTGGSAGAAAALGLLALGVLLLVCVMVLSNWFLFISYFKKVGQNMKSKKVMKASTTAALTCIGAIVFFVISTIVAAVMLNFMPESRQTLVNVYALLNVLVGAGVTATILVMIKTTLDVLKKKKSAA